jgi:hypothetical protein
MDRSMSAKMPVLRAVHGNGSYTYIVYTMSIVSLPPQRLSDNKSRTQSKGGSL